MKKESLAMLLSNPLGFVLFCFVILLCIVSMFPDLFVTKDPYEVHPGQKLQKPNLNHLFGTDRMGRDIYSRVIFGTRYSLGASLITVLVSLIVGSIIGIIAGWKGGLTDNLLMRFVDILLAFPIIILAMAFIGALGPGLKNAVLALVMIWWGQYARIARAQVLKVKEEAYIEAAKAIGATNIQIVWKHIIPNISFVILVKGTLDVGAAILVIGSLSFIGFGALPPSPEWGLMVVEARSYLIDFWWYPVIPGFAIFMTVMTFNFLGDILRDIYDPKLVNEL